MAKPILDDTLWKLIEPFIPVTPRRFRNPGRKPIGRRTALTGILFVLKTGIPWEDLPQQQFGVSGVTCWRRLRDWQEAGVWEEIHEMLLAELRRCNVLDMSVAAVDSSSIRAVGGAKKQARTRRIVVGRAASTILSPTPTACRSRRSLRARMCMTAHN